MTDKIREIVNKAKIAQEQISTYNQNQLDELTYAVAWTVMQTDRNKSLSEMAVQETGLGKVEDKIAKNYRKTLGLLRDLKNKKTCGVINTNDNLGLIEIARPIGVIGALVPSTNPIATPINKIINALKSGNSVIVSPSPKGAKVFEQILKYIHQAFKKINAPLDLVQQMPMPPTKEATLELMKLVDLIVITGSINNVRAAYSSGTPAVGVGTGNVTTIIDETADLAAAAHKIKLSKTFDNATSCSSENNAVILKEVYDETLAKLRQEGGYLLKDTEKQILESSMWPDGKLNTNLIAKTATEIAQKCDINVPKNCEFLMVEESNIGANFPFSRERMSPILSLYKTDDFTGAMQLGKKLLLNQGAGHSIGIHTAKTDRALSMGLTLPTCRVIVNQAHCFATGGAFNNGMPFSLSMGCGSWGQNSINENMNYKHYMNITRIVKEIPVNEPSLDNIFGEYFNKYGNE